MIDVTLQKIAEVLVKDVLGLIGRSTLVPLAVVDGQELARNQAVSLQKTHSSKHSISRHVIRVIVHSEDWYRLASVQPVRQSHV
jgi:hypothetical protein